MRGSLATASALFLALQGAQAFGAPGRTWSHSGAHISGTHHFHPHFVSPVRVIPRYVYVAPYVPYYPSPYYSTPSYYQDPYAAPSYYPPDPGYVEQPQSYAPPPPPPSYATQPQPRGQPGQYSVEQGIQYRYLCLDTRKFYPDTRECPSGWLTVMPGGGNPPR